LIVAGGGIMGWGSNSRILWSTVSFLLEIAVDIPVIQESFIWPISVHGALLNQDCLPRGPK